MALSTEAELGKTYLPDIKVADLSLPGPYADLPIAALRRSNGALPEGARRSAWRRKYANSIHRAAANDGQ